MCPTKKVVRGGVGHYFLQLARQFSSSIFFGRGQRELKIRRNFMGKALIGIFGLIVGAALGIFLVAPVMTGAAAGVGVRYAQ